MGVSLAAGEYIQFPDVTGVLSLWFRTSLTVTGIPPELCSQHQSTASGPGWGVLIQADGTLGMYGKDSPPSTLFNLGGTTVVNDGVWHHLLVNMWFSTAHPQQLWLDGVLQDEDLNSGNYNPVGAAGRIGAGNDSFWGLYSGDIGEVAMWGGPGRNEWFSPDKIAALAAGFPPASVSLYDFRGWMPMRDGLQDEVAVSGQPTISGGTFFQDDYRHF